MTSLVGKSKRSKIQKVRLVVPPTTNP